MKNHRLIRFLVILFTLVVILSCSLPPHTFLTVNRVAVADQTPYLLVSELGMGCGKYQVYFYTSPDQGRTWQKITPVPITMPPEITKPPQAAVHTCVPANPKICYRIAGKEQVEASQDGGQTWQVDWQMPVGRKAFMARNPVIAPYRSFRVEPDTVPYDLGVIQNGSQHWVIVAMGNQGVLVRSPEGTWHRQGIAYEAADPKDYQYCRYNADPLPYTANNLAEVNPYLEMEFGWDIFLGVSLFLWLSLWAWRNLYLNSEAQIQNKIKWIQYLFIVAKWSSVLLALFVLLDLYFIFAGDLNYISALSRALYPVYACPILFFLILWIAIVSRSPNRRFGFRAASLAFGYTLLFLAGFWLPFVLWALGVIPIYQIALALAVGFGLLIILTAFRQVKRAAIQAAGKRDAHTPAPVGT